MLLTSKSFLEFLLNFEHDAFIKLLIYIWNVLIMFLIRFVYIH